MRIVMDVCSTRSSPADSNKPGKTVGQRQRPGEQLVPCDGGARIETRCGVPKDALIDEAAEKIPHRRYDGTAGYGHALDFVQHLDWIGDKIQNELGCGAAKRRISVWQPNGIH